MKKDYLKIWADIDDFGEDYWVTLKVGSIEKEYVIGSVEQKSNFEIINELEEFLEKNGFGKKEYTGYSIIMKEIKEPLVELNLTSSCKVDIMISDILRLILHRSKYPEITINLQAEHFA